MGHIPTPTLGANNEGGRLHKRFRLSGEVCSTKDWRTGSSKGTGRSGRDAPSLYLSPVCLESPIARELGRQTPGHDFEHALLPIRAPSEVNHMRI